MTSTAGISILIPGALHPHARQRIERDFDAVLIERSDVSLIPAEAARSIRGIASMTKVDAALIDALPALEIIANFGVGYDSVDSRHAALRGVMVTNTPDVLT